MILDDNNFSDVNNILLRFQNAIVGGDLETIRHLVYIGAVNPRDCILPNGKKPIK